MIQVRRSEDRGHEDHGWLDARHTFSFARYYDPEHMGFRALRVINEDVVRPGRGFAMHPHDNMEIITYLLSGTLRHKDSLGHQADLVPGRVQRISAGTGLLHSESNPSTTEPVHLLQIWIEPNVRDVRPDYAEVGLDEASYHERLGVVASGKPGDGPIVINADARLLAGRFRAGSGDTLRLGKGRHGWVQVVRGEVVIEDKTLKAGDGAAISGIESVGLLATSDAEVLAFDLA
ncbi:MAG: pirin family protein [Phycisphaerae bacterium]|nr:pirin family protein [Phycisphaerae bacterium]